METRKISSSCSIGTDRLSNLPEPILHHILSFLDMKFVIPTCVLSRRWRNLWSSLSFLSFDADVYKSCLNRNPSESYSYKKFSDFVNMVLLVRASTSIQSFNLIWDPCPNFKRFTQWIHTAVLRNVKEINAEVHCRSYLEIFKLPDCLFTSKSLTSLSLSVYDRVDNTAEPILGDKIYLPSLKTLHLESVDFSAYDNPFDILFVGCPALETLILKECEFPVLTISSLQLKHLRIETPCVKVFILIHAPKLIDYSWRSFLCSVFSLEGLSCLETANIEREECYNQFRCKDSKDLKLLLARAVKGTMESLKGLYNVKCLTLSSDCLQLISEFPSKLEKWSAPFSNLRYLNVETWLTRGCFEVTIFLLKSSPNIETLVLRMDPIESEKTVEHGVESSFNLKLHHLKVVELQNASGCKNELQHLKILLGNAEVLEKITIVQSSDQDKDAKKWKVFTAEVLTLPQVSPDVTINIQTTKKMDIYHC